MILKWPELPFKPEEQVLGMLFDGGMLTREQIKILTGWTDTKVAYCFRRIYKKAGTEEEPMIRHRFLPGPRFRFMVYSLTVTGVRYVYDMLGIEHRVRVAPEGQLAHYMGINNIAVRTVQRYGRQNVTWLSSREITEEIALSRRLYGNGESEKSRVVRPDAAVGVNGGRSAWIEYDNATESTAKLEGKFRAYANLHKELGKHMKPVVWVTPTEARKNFLQRVYIALRKQIALPDDMQHLFFTEGEEQDWLGGGKQTVREASEQAL
ncbi:replication-relaxation family protein [Alicyclobacillus pomorum]|jgi:hypothetical protein|uniref:replication-relaxation family protein n=1 Tax=Alicyclobacillus pomorum TaxID=204470 RepID=UPI00047D5BF2|nr:replication-relaxation family protein [Alicyclobacillus pomorum]